MWLHFLKHWNGVSVFYESKLISNADMELFTDASSTICFGGYYKGKWFAQEWPLETKTKKQPPSMAFLEFYPIVVVAILWGKEWKTKKIIFWCDNAAVVDFIRKRRFKNIIFDNSLLVCRYLQLWHLQWTFVENEKHLGWFLILFADGKVPACGPSSRGNPDGLPTDIRSSEELRQLVKKLMCNSLTERTRSTYKQGLETYIRFCFVLTWCYFCP